MIFGKRNISPEIHPERDDSDLVAKVRSAQNAKLKTVPQKEGGSLGLRSCRRCEC
jgi:hypothetical protein